MKWLATISAVTIVGLCFLIQAVAVRHSYETREPPPPYLSKTTTSVGWPMVYQEDAQETHDCIVYDLPLEKNSWALLINPILALVAMVGAALAVNAYFASRPRWYRFRLYEVLIAVAVGSAALGAERAGLTTWGQMPIWLAWAAAAVLIPWLTISMLRNRSTTEPITYFGPSPTETH